MNEAPTRGGILEFEPEPIDQLRARFSAALEPMYDIAELAALPLDPESSPMRQRKHAFDFNDGLRLGISRDNINGPMLHVSARVFPGMLLAETMEHASLGEWRKVILDRLAQLDGTGRHRSILIEEISPTGFLHLFFFI